MARRPFNQNGSIIIAIFAAIAAVGVVGAATMNTMKGPVRSMHNVTQKTIAENNMIAAGKLALMAAINQDNGGDCDEDGTIEPLPFSTTGDGPHPIGGGYLPQTIGTAKLDPWGNEYGYCVWDHGTSIHSVSCGTDRLRGAADENGIVIAVMSSGPDRVFQTSCGDAPDYVIRGPASDDIVLAYSYAEAATMSGGLWNIKAGDPDIAEIGKSLEVRDAASGDVTFALDSASGIGDFIGIVTGSIASKTSATPVRMAGGLKVDSDANVATCDAQNIGTLRYHHANGLEVCDGTGWQGAGGGAVPAGTIAAFASNTCPSGWSEYSPARGRFLRGRDPAGTNDVVRSAGNIQADMNKAHTHSGTAASAGAHTHGGTAASAGAHTHSGSTSSTAAVGATVFSYGNQSGSYAYGIGGGGNAALRSSSHSHTLSINSAGAHTHTLTINSAGAHTHDLTIGSEGGVESRPKNVAVTFCQYNGGAPVTEIAGLGNLHDVVLSAPTVGQVLSFDGTNWINQNSQSYWSLSGTSLSYTGGNVGIGTGGPSERLHVSGNALISGDVTATGFYYSSDARLKENIEPLTQKQIDALYRLRGVSFDWQEGGRADIGLIAQEVEKQYPQLVATNSSGMKSVKYGNLVALLLEAMKRQQSELEKQQIAIDTLRHRLDKLESAP